MIERINNFKKRLQSLYNETNNLDKSILMKLIEMCDLSELTIHNNDQLDESQISNYYDSQASVGRYFCDWNLDWVSLEYYAIAEYIKEHHRKVHII